jgi:hypothetical protein
VQVKQKHEIDDMWTRILASGKGIGTLLNWREQASNVGADEDSGELAPHGSAVTNPACVTLVSRGGLQPS